MMIVHSLDMFLEELMYNPGELFVLARRDSCALYDPETDEFYFLNGDFSGNEEACRAEVRRQLEEMNPQRRW
jgi:hypothetical protein